MKIQRVRHIYLDYLRILATLAVICIHTSCLFFEETGLNFVGIGSRQWNTAMVYDSISRFCVPMFLMISGALFLGRPLSIKSLYRKYILRIILAYLFWSLMYVLLAKDFGIRALLVGTLSGGPRFYFLCLIIGLYMITPLMNKLIDSPKTGAYFLIMCFLFGFLEPQLFNLLGNRAIPYISLLIELIHEFVNRM